MNHTEKIIKLISSEMFKARMETINTNYFNLMQEGVIRNAILELFNENPIYHEGKLRAIAEFRIGKRRYDLCIVDSQEIGNIFKIELKFRFSKLRKEQEPYLPIENDFVSREADLFILIVSGGSVLEKQSLHQFWGVENTLLKHISQNDIWEQRYLEGVQRYTDNLNAVGKFSTSFHANTVATEEPPYTQYAFFVLSKEKTNPAIN